MNRNVVPAGRRSMVIPAMAATLIAIVAMLLAAPARSATEALFADMAGEILAGIDGTRHGEVPAVSGYGVPAIGIRPFSGDGLPLPAEAANDYNRRLLFHLKDQARGRYSFVALDALGDLEDEIRAAAISPEAAAAQIEVLRANARADVLITGSLRLDDGAPVISYRAVGVDNGRLLAATQPRRIPHGMRRPSPSPVPVGQAEAELPPPIADDLQLRHRRLIAETENLLWELGYDPGPVDGVMTRQTRAALRAYQTDSALPVTGRMSWRVVENMRRDMR